jgi:hypothetical protein
MISKNPNLGPRTMNTLIKSLLTGFVIVAVAWPLLSWAMSKNRDQGHAEIARQTQFTLTPQYDLQW